jgi:hypothetical protein
VNASKVVLLADVVGSRRVSSFVARRDKVLGDASRRHRQDGLTLTAYAVTAWDEFQALADDLARVPTLIWDLRLRFHPLRLRVAVGWGAIRTMPRPGRKVNREGSGPAFESARRAMEEIRTQKGIKQRVATRVASGDREFDLVINTVYRLHDALFERITERQWEVILTQEQKRKQGETAAALGVDKSTVSRTLARAGYWELKESVAVLQGLLARRATVASSNANNEKCI